MLCHLITHRFFKQTITWLKLNKLIFINLYQRIEHNYLTKTTKTHTPWKSSVLHQWNNIQSRWKTASMNCISSTHPEHPSAPQTSRQSRDVYHWFALNPIVQCAFTELLSGLHIPHNLWGALMKSIPERVLRRLTGLPRLRVGWAPSPPSHPSASSCIFF